MIAKTNEEAYARLSAPFGDVKVRIGRILGKPRDFKPAKGDTAEAFVLHYVSATQVMDRLDEVLGPGNWWRKNRVVFSPQDGRAFFTSSVRVMWPDGQLSVHEDMAGETDVEGEKGGASDSFKRACVNLGIARYLYSLGDTRAQVRCYNFGWSIPHDEQKRLREALGTSGGSVTPPASTPPVVGPSQAQSGAEKDDALLREDRDEALVRLKAAVGETEAMQKLSEVRDLFGAWAGLDVGTKEKYNEALWNRVEDAELNHS